jgi:hypothetical protein
MHPTRISASAASNLDEAWRVMDHSVPVGTPVETGYQFKLFNLTNDEMLVRKNQRWGIDLDFIPDPQTGFEGIKFERQAGAGAVTYHEPIAIYVVNGGYLTYQSGHTTTVGLAYRSVPAYEWEFTGGAVGQTVRTGHTAGLFNNRIDKWLKWQFKFTGINLGFASPPTPITNAQVSINWRVGPALSANLPCSSTLTVRFVPLNLTGSTGLSTTQTVTRAVSATTQLFGPGEYYCVYHILTGGLRTGTWRIEGSAPLWSTSGTAPLHAGTNTANFTQGENGCIVNDPSSYP